RGHRNAAVYKNWFPLRFQLPNFLIAGPAAILWLRWLGRTSASKLPCGGPPPYSSSTSSHSRRRTKRRRDGICICWLLVSAGVLAEALRASESRARQTGPCLSDSAAAGGTDGGVKPPLQRRRDVVRDPIACFVGAERAAEVGRALPFPQRGAHGGTERVAFPLPPRVIAQHGARQDGTERIGQIFSGDGGRAAVDRLEQGNLAWVDIGGGRKSKATGKLGAEVADDVTEQVIRHDHVELRGIADHFHGQRVDVEVAGIRFRMLFLQFAEDALPQVVAVGEGVRFVAHAEAMAGPRGGVLEREPEDALDALAGVQLFLHGDLIGGAALELAADIDVQAFRVFAKDNEIDVGLGAVAQRGEAAVEEHARAHVYVEVETEAQAEQDVQSVLVGRHAGIADGAEQDGVEVAAQHFDRAGGQRDAFAKEAAGGPIEIGEFGCSRPRGERGAQGFEAFGGYIGADA